MTTTSRPSVTLQDTYAHAVPDLVVAWAADPAPAPRVVVLNTGLAAELGLDPDLLRADGLLTGRVPDGVTPVAQAYAGHQFGRYQPRLGDGRALLLGELAQPGPARPGGEPARPGTSRPVTTRSGPGTGGRVDLHLKGSGPTPFSRGGDGKAALGPMLREYVMGEAMHALGIPTSRALAVTVTGERIARDGALLPGAVLTRVAASHLRIGTFQYAANAHGPEVVRALADHAIARHHPQAAEAPEPYLELYRSVIDVQASLVARWMGVGFVHGVMNTDNTTISGETIDYGPCAFIDAYDPTTVFSSIDHAGRYAFGRQPEVLQWNLARLGEALLPLIDADPEVAVEKAVAAVDGFAADHRRHWLEVMRAKLGLRKPDAALVDDLLLLLRENAVDWTSFFRALTDGPGGATTPPSPVRGVLGEGEALAAWVARWGALRDPAVSDADLDRVNPLYVPRNHLIEEALDAATAGDMAPFERLLDVLTRPFDERAGAERYTEAGTGPHVTYCGT